MTEEVGTVLVIKDWARHFEIAQSRKISNNHRWFPCPNKHDGKSFRRIAAHRSGTDIFTAWVLMCQVASKCERRGILMDEDGPISPEDIALKTGFPQHIFDLAIPILLDSKIGWLEERAVDDLPEEDEVVPSKTPKQAKLAFDYTPAFESFWEAYPRKVSKGASAKKFHAALAGGVTAEKIIEAAKAYADKIERDGTEQKYVKHASAWLNQGCWDDDYSAPAVRRRGPNI